MAYYTDSSLPLIGKQPAGGTVEICRSFAYKLNMKNHGGPDYESADFFASRKMQCAAESAEWVSAQLLEECVQEVRAACAAFIAEMRRRRTAPRNNGALVPRRPAVNGSAPASVSVDDIDF